MGLLISSYRLLGTVERLLMQFSYSYSNCYSTYSCLSTYRLIDSRGSCTQPQQALNNDMMVGYVMRYSCFTIPSSICSLHTGITHMTKTIRTAVSHTPNTHHVSCDAPPPFQGCCHVSGCSVQLGLGP